MKSLFLLIFISFSFAKDICPIFSLQSKTKANFIKNMLKKNSDGWELKKVVSCLDLQTFSLSDFNKSPSIIEVAFYKHKKFGTIKLNLLIRKDANKTKIYTTKDIINGIKNNSYLYNLKNYTLGKIDDFNLTYIDLEYKNIPLFQMLDIYLSKNSILNIIHNRKFIGDINNLKVIDYNFDLASWAGKNLILKTFINPYPDIIIDNSKIENIAKEEALFESIIKMRNKDLTKKKTEFDKKIDKLMKELEKL